MTREEFIDECDKRLIDPNLAIENEQIRERLRNRDDLAVIALLESEF